MSAVLWTDFLMFAVAMGGSIAAAVYVLNLDGVGGSAAYWHTPRCSRSSRCSPIGARNAAAGVHHSLVVQWWSVWYPGSEPGGGGYIAQRMLAAKNETHATGATLLFNIAH